MAFEGLSDKLEAAFKKLRGKGKLTETDVRNAMREVRLALLEADVNYKVARDFTAKVTERAIGAQVMESLTPGQMVVKIVNEELTELMGGTRSRLASAPHPPTVGDDVRLAGCWQNDLLRKAWPDAEKSGESPSSRGVRHLPPGGDQAAPGGWRKSGCARV